MLPWRKGGKEGGSEVGWWVVKFGVGAAKTRL